MESIGDEGIEESIRRFDCRGIERDELLKCLGGRKKDGMACILVTLEAVCMSHRKSSAKEEEDSNLDAQVAQLVVLQ